MQSRKIRNGKKLNRKMSYKIPKRLQSGAKTKKPAAKPAAKSAAKSATKPAAKPAAPVVPHRTNVKPKQAIAVGNKVASVQHLELKKAASKANIKNMTQKGMHSNILGRISGDVKGFTSAVTGSILHPQKEGINMLNGFLRKHVVSSIKAKLPNEMSVQAKDEEANKLAKKIFDTPAVKGKLDAKILNLVNKFKGQGYTALDEGRHALVEAIPIPEVPEIIDDIIDSGEFTAFLGADAIRAAGVVETAAEAKGAMDEGAEQVATSGGRRRRRRTIKKNLIKRRLRKSKRR